mgnify:FL=1
MLWIIDYIDPYVSSSDCLILDAVDKDEALRKAIEELKLLKIPKRYIVNLEKFWEVLIMAKIVNSNDKDSKFPNSILGKSPFLFC